MAEHDPLASENALPENGDSTSPESPQIPDPRTGTTITPESLPHPAARTDEATVLSQRSPLSVDPPIPLRMSDIGKALVGKELKHFRLESFIGGGGMGAVFKATDNQLERPVAVKVLTHRFGQDDEMVRRFKVEAQSAARLNHENIAAVYFVGEDKGWNFIVFEYIEGENIRDLIARTGPLTVEQSVTLIIQIAEALDHANQRDVVHRDIKPSNILITPEGKAKLVDMGLARLQQVEASNDDLTVSGVTLGTFDYISPEQGRDPRNADVRSDLYSLGCTFFYMLTGNPPYPNGTALQKLLSHTSDPPSDPRSYRSGIPDEIAHAVLKLLAKKPEERFQSPMELIAEMLRSGSRLGFNVHSASPVISVPSPIPSGRSSILPWLAPLLILASVIFVVDQMERRSIASSRSLPEFRLPTAPQPESTSLAPAQELPPPSEIQDVTQPASGDEVRMPNVEAKRPEMLSPPDPNADTPASVAVLANKTTTDSTPLANVSKSAVIGETEKLSDKVTDATKLDRSLPIYVVPDSETVIEDDSITVGSLSEALNYRTGETNSILIAANELVVAPFTVSSDVVLRPAKGFHPVIRFDSSQKGEAAAGITLEFADLIVDQIDFEVDLDQSRLGCLVSITGSHVVEISNSSIRVTGTPQTENVACVFQARPQATPPIFSNGNEGNAAIELLNCVIVGDSCVVHMPQATPLRFDWTNGLLVTSESIIRSGGSDDALRDSNLIRVDFDHLTAYAEAGIMQNDVSSLQPHLMMTDINATRSIFVTSPQSAFLQSMVFEAFEEELDSQLLFNGERNFYEGGDEFWKFVVVNENSMPQRSEAMSFADWQRREQTKDIRWQRNKVKWQKPLDIDSITSAVPNDFRLSDSPSNPALRAGGGVDRRDAGMIIDELPKPFWLE